jgi:hypothetical protein
MTHLCYGCDNVFKYKELAYECMCIHDEDPQYRGVCKTCDINNIKIPSGHHLQKIHQFSNEYKDFWIMLENKCPSWGGLFFNDGKIVISHPNFPEGIKTWDEFTEKDPEAAEALQYSGPNRSKQTTLDITEAQLDHMSKCICCKN